MNFEVLHQNMTYTYKLIQENENLFDISGLTGSCI